MVFRPGAGPVIEPASVYAFEGKITGLGYVRVTVFGERENPVVVFDSEDGRSNWTLFGAFQNGQLAVEDQTWVGDGEAPRKDRRIDASLTTNPLALQGTLTDSRSGQVREFDLTGVATYVRMSQKSGIRLRDRGWSFAVSSVFPEFVDPNPLEVETTAWLRQEAADEARASLDEWHFDWREKLDMVVHPSATAEWESETRWTVKSRSERVISLLAENYSYTGGAHGNHGSRGYTFWKQEGDVLQVELPDLFRENSGWETNVASLVVADLVRQGASGVVTPFDGKPYKLDLGSQPPTFTVNRAGISFQFDPYEVGSYAEDSFQVFIPFKSVESWLRKDGPMKDVLTPPKPRR